MSSSLTGTLSKGENYNNLQVVREDSPENLNAYFSGLKICVVTALKEELDSLMRYCCKPHEIVIHKNRVYYKLTFSKKGKEFSVIAHTLNQMGISSMSINLTEIINVFSGLRYVGVIGIAAGANKESQKKGDILIPTAVFNYEMGKYIEIPDENNPEISRVIFESDYESHHIDSSIQQKISIITNEAFLKEIMGEWIRQYKQIGCHEGNLACGSAVIASEKKVKEIRGNVARKCIGIDMESFAVSNLNQLKSNREIEFFIIKAISDFAGVDKNDDDRVFANDMAVKVFIEFCTILLIE